ncbi:MAG: class I SAM-dependent methyltransferase [Gemmatimonadaceae bacterium]
MTEASAIALIRDGIPHKGGAWADLGAGSGTFTMALARLLGRAGTVHAVERDANALLQLEQNAKASRYRNSGFANVIGMHADFTATIELPLLDGVLIANALHFVPYAQHVPLLRAFSARLTSAGRIVLVEYDRDRAHQYNPFPISATMLPGLAAQAGLREPIFHARTPSAFGGDLYCASILMVE